MERNVYSRLPAALLPWYEGVKRDLPWRGDPDPYHIWLSEIMLQQTRVEAVKGYYSRFLQALPDIAALANADDELLQKLWEGLGYYSRVRNLKKAACVIMEQHGGVFPREYGDILALPGIGDYTAGAVASIAFDQKKAAVDGNVLRVITRLTADGTPIDSPAYKRQVRQSLERVYPSAAGAFTQALMELGATVCGPNRQPRCELCPCRDFCKAAADGTQDSFPVKQKRQARRVQEMTVFILSCDGEYALVKRPDRGLLAGLWQFPNVPGKLELEQAVSCLRKRGVTVKDIYRQLEKKHIFTHIQWEMTGFYLETTEQAATFTWFSPEQIQLKAALPTAFRQFWEETKNV